MYRFCNFLLCCFVVVQTHNHHIKSILSKVKRTNETKYNIFITINNGIIMEKSTLNGTTTNDQAWKEKKGFAPLIMLTALLLGLAFYAGQMSGGGTVATRGGAKASMMSFDAFESMMSGTQDCDHDCCYGQICDPSSATSCGKGKPQCDYSIITCTLQTPKIPVPVPVYRCQSGY